MANRRRRRGTTDSPQQHRTVSAAGLILFGLIIGLAGALYYAWVVAPVVYTNASPARFSDEYKDEYLLLISQNYAIDGDWQAAEQRLDALDDPELVERITALLERYLREQRPPETIRAVAVVAEKLGGDGRAVALFAPTPLSGLPTASPTPTATPFTLPTAPPANTPTPTSTPAPSPTPTPPPTAVPTAVSVYRLLSQERLCDGDDTARLEVETLDANADPLPGVKTAVSWQNGNDNFFTGFKPSLGEAVGDFVMVEGIAYAVMLPDGSPEVSGLRLELCENGRLGGWRLVFQNLTPIVNEE